jgi:hypothetical protein
MRYNYGQNDPNFDIEGPNTFRHRCVIHLPALRSLSPPRTAAPSHTPIPPPVLPRAADLGTRIGIHRHRRPAPRRAAHGPTFAARAEATGYGGVLRVLHARLARRRVVSIR